MKTKSSLILCIFIALSQVSMIAESPVSPYVLITPDYGILTLDDLNREATSDAEPGPLVNGRPSSGLAWQCLPIEHISFECQRMGFNDSTQEYAMLPVLNLIQDGQFYEFYPRRPWDQEVCDTTVEQWRNAIAGEGIACFSARYNGDRSTEESAPYANHSSWIINRIKSLHGSWSYWDDSDSDENDTPD